MRSAIVTRVGTKLGVLLVVVLAVGVSASSAVAATPWWSTPFGLTTEFRLEGGSTGVTFETAAGSSSLKTTSCTAGPKGILYLGVNSQGRQAEEIQLTGCKAGSAYGGSCNSPGAGEGVIKLNPMVLQLEYLSPANHEVGLVWNYQKSGEVATFASYSCKVLGVAVKFTLRGTVLAKITPVKKKSTSSRLP
jgi:hypothetical protein